MGAYFPISDNPRHTATMVYLRNCLPDSQSEPPIFPTDHPIMYTNCSSVDLQPSHPNTSQQDILLNFGSLRAIENQWKESRDEVVMMGSAGSCVHQSDPNLQGQGLSLSLSTNVPAVLQMRSIHYPNNANFSPVLGHNGQINPNESGDGYHAKQTSDGDYVGVANEVAPLGATGIAMAVSSYKYLRVAQELLNEVVSVKDVRGRNAKKENLKDLKENEGDLDTPKASGNSSGELSVAEKQELQSKMSKLLAMLDEVDRRYKQYYHQMQIVVSSFDEMAGPGAAKPYTSLALQTISRHFRCLRDAINAQIQTARKSLAEDDASALSGDKGIGISRLRYVDKQLRQQRALQQLGIMQQHAWRPQRGLPETSVSILRSWLFEHFLHPYPKDSEKIMLAWQAGLTKSQVSNWFINARVRLWKPMVEEMYKEETGVADMDSNSSFEETSTKDKGEDSHQATSSTGLHLTESKPTNPMTNTEILGPDKEGQNGLFTDRDGRLYLSATATSYHMSELGRIGGVDLVSLSLGPQQGEGGSSNDHCFIPMREGVGYHDAGAAMTNEAAEFEYMVNSGNRQLPFVSSLLPSFS